MKLVINGVATMSSSSASHHWQVNPRTQSADVHRRLSLTNGFLVLNSRVSWSAWLFPDERRNQFADTLTYTSGDHTIKFGGDINFVKDIINNLRFSGGQFNYTGGANALNYFGGLGDFILDYNNFQGALAQPAAGGRCYSSTRASGLCYGGNFDQGLGVLGLTMSTTDFNLFMQDDWRVTPKLTLNIGLRYEYQSNPTNDAARINSTAAADR